MADASYRLSNDEEVALNNNVNHSDVKIARNVHNSSSKTSRIFLLIVVLLFVSCVTLIILYSMERARNMEAKNARESSEWQKTNASKESDGSDADKEDNGPKCPGSVDPDDVCTAKNCIHLASGRTVGL